MPPRTESVPLEHCVQVTGFWWWTQHLKNQHEPVQLNRRIFIDFPFTWLTAGMISELRLMSVGESNLWE